MNSPHKQPEQPPLVVPLASLSPAGQVPLQAKPARHPWRSLGVLLAAYASMSVILAVMIAQALHLDSEELYEESDADFRTKVSAVLYIVLDFVVVVLAWFFAGRPRAYPATWHRLATWIVATITLAPLLALNFLYSHLIVRLIRGEDGIFDVMAFSLNDPWWAIGIVCVQPAIMEELFFRYLLQGHLRQHVSQNAAIWVTATLFAMAHLSSFVNWPILLLLGAFLGYARVASGSMLLPILLHFLHNLAVLYFEWEA